MENNEYFTGLIPDPREEEKKAKDYQHAELYGALPLNWVEKTPDQWRKFPIRNQDGSGQCVAFSCAMALGVNNLLENNKFENLSPRYIYSKRVNQDSAGMWLQNAFEISCKHGSPLDTFLPSDLLNEQQANEPFTETPEMTANAQLFKGKSYLFCRNIDEIAQVIARGLAVPICATWKFDEWTSVPKVIHRPVDSSFARHCVTGVDYFLYNGEKAILVNESWGSEYGNDGLRILTESFLNERMTGAGYIIDLVNVPPPVKPVHHFTVPLYFGMQEEPDVKALQNILKYEGLFPTNTNSTGNYYEITRKAVLAYQRKYKVASEAELTMLQGRRVGYKTIVSLNSKYNN